MAPLAKCDPGRIAWAELAVAAHDRRVRVGGRAHGGTTREGHRPLVSLRAGERLTTRARTPDATRTTRRADPPAPEAALGACTPHRTPRLHARRPCTLVAVLGCRTVGLRTERRMAGGAPVPRAATIRRGVPGHRPSGPVRGPGRPLAGRFASPVQRSSLSGPYRGEPEAKRGGQLAARPAPPCRPERVGRPPVHGNYGARARHAPSRPHPWSLSAPRPAKDARVFPPSDRGVFMDARPCPPRYKG